MSDFSDIDNIIKDNKLYRFKSEYDDTEDEDRKKYLEIVVQHLQTIKTKKDITDDLVNSHLSVLKHLKYQKKWKCMNKELKYDRLAEFCTRNNYKEKILKRLIKGIDNKTLKNKDVKYDIAKGQITEIHDIDEHIKKIPVKKVKKKISKTNK